MYLFAFVCPETDDSSGMVSCLFGNVLLQIAISYRCFVSKRLVDFNNKVVLEVFGNSTAVACSVADNLVLFGNYFDSNYLIISKLYFFVIYLNLYNLIIPVLTVKSFFLRKMLKDTKRQLFRNEVVAFSFFVLMNLPVLFVGRFGIT